MRNLWEYQNKLACFLNVLSLTATYADEKEVMSNSGTNVIKLFTATSYEFYNQLEYLLAPGKPSQPSLLFLGKARSLP
jgi:hypothetical protein